MCCDDAGFRTVVADRIWSPEDPVHSSSSRNKRHITNHIGSSHRKQQCRLVVECREGHSLHVAHSVDFRGYAWTYRTCDLQMQFTVDETQWLHLVLLLPHRSCYCVHVADAALPVPEQWKHDASCHSTLVVDCVLPTYKQCVTCISADIAG